MTQHRVTICIFAKPPAPGAVKTRLVPALGAEGAASLARAFLIDTVAQVRAVPWARAVLASTGDLAPFLPGPRLPRWSQGDGDLGQRLERVLRRALAEGGPAVAIGADTPGLPPHLLEQARDALEGAGSVLGPAEDGGFYLLGLTRCPEGLLSSLPWSRHDTMTHTRRRLVERGLPPALLDPWFDVDTPEDLQRLARLIREGRVRADETARALPLYLPRGR